MQIRTRAVLVPAAFIIVVGAEGRLRHDHDRAPNAALDCPTSNHPYQYEYEYDPDVECLIMMTSGDESTSQDRRLSASPDSVVVMIDPNITTYSRNAEIDGRLMTAAQAAIEAPGIARAIGPNARVGKAVDYLRCVRYDCAASTRFAVVIVHQASEYTNGTRVMVELYLPASGENESGMKQGSMVEVARNGEGWAGVRWQSGSPVQPVRVPPP